MISHYLGAALKPGYMRDTSTRGRMHVSHPDDFDIHNQSNNGTVSVIPNLLDDLTNEEKDFLEVECNKIKCQIVRGNRDAISEIADSAISTLRKKDVSSSLLETPLTIIIRDLRICNTLETYARCITLGDYLQTEHNQLLAIPNFGTLSINTSLRNVAAYCVKRCLEYEAKQ